MNRLQELAGLKEDWNPVGNIPKEQIIAAFKNARDKYMGAKPFDDSFREEGKKALETMKKHGIVSYNDIRGYELLTYKLEELANVPSDVAALGKAQATATTVTNKAKTINSIQEFPGAFEGWFTTLGFQPGKINKSTIRSEVEKVLTKLGYK
jgi:hypothetical protein